MGMFDDIINYFSKTSTKTTPENDDEKKKKEFPSFKELQSQRISKIDKMIADAQK